MNLNIIPWIISLLAIVGGIGYIVHVKHQLDRVPILEQQIKDQQKVASQALANYKQSEAYRQQERAAANAAMTAAQTDCDARVQELRRTTNTIRTITHAPVKVDLKNCPVRELYDTRVLSDAVGARR